LNLYNKALACLRNLTEVPEQPLTANEIKKNIRRLRKNLLKLLYLEDEQYFSKETYDAIHAILINLTRYLPLHRSAAADVICMEDGYQFSVGDFYKERGVVGYFI